MDDYKPGILSEARNEWSLELVSTLTPHLLEGINAIFNEAWNLCQEHGEEEKYLMTFQTFLERVPKWNQEMVKYETQRIIRASKCHYLDDLLSCVHVTQTKIMTSMRVTNHRKFIKTAYPDMQSFIHQVYNIFADKLYVNAYLFQKNISGLTFQKNRRETELLCKESILEAIRKSIPIENILKSYLDETTDEDVIEKVEEIIVEEPVAVSSQAIDTSIESEQKGEEDSRDKYKKVLSEAVETMKINKIEGNDNTDTVKIDSIKINGGSTKSDIPIIEGLTNENNSRKSAIGKNNDVTIKVELNNNTSGNQRINNMNDTKKRDENSSENPRENTNENKKDDVININTVGNNAVKTVPPTPQTTPVITSINEQEQKQIPISPMNLGDAKKENNTSLRFNDDDKVLDLGTNEEKIVSAPKNIERLEQISEIRNRQRKAEMEEEYSDDEEDFVDFENIKIDKEKPKNFNLGFSSLPPL